LVFVGQEDQPVGQGNFRKRSFHKLLKQVGLAVTSRQKGIHGLRLHDLRHTMATIARRQGVDILVLSRSSGHSRPSTTLNVYSHVLPAMASEEAAKMDAVLRPKKA
jgi:integrase